MEQCIINSKYKITGKLGSGKFGNIYKATNIKTNMPVAIKMEDVSATIQLLRHETTILNYLYNEGTRNIPAVFWYGVYGENLCTAMTLFDHSLLDYMKAPMIAETIYSVIGQCVLTLESIHKNFVIHRDIKPENIMVKDGRARIIDFGLSMFYVNEKREHLVNEPRTELTGTPKWASVFLHQGNSVSRRDDLVSLAYVFLFLLNKGSLAWNNVSIDEVPPADQNVFINNSSKKYVYKNGKKYEVPERTETCGASPHGEIAIAHPKNIVRRLHKENLDSNQSIRDPILKKFISHCYGLSYNEEPDYDLLIDILKNNIKK